MAVGQHSAAASASGYLYQTSWALLELLRQAPNRPDQALTLEMHDDIAWEDASGNPTELLQAKLHRKRLPGSVTGTRTSGRRWGTGWRDRRPPIQTARISPL